MILVLIILCLLAVCISLLYAKNSREKNYIAVFYCGIVQVSYLILTPLYNFIYAEYNAFNTRLLVEDIEYGLFILLIHLVFLHLGYHYNFNRSSPIPRTPLLNGITPRRLKFCYLVIFVAIAVNMANGEISLYNILLGNEGGVTLGFKGATYWVASFADSLIILLVILFSFGRLNLFVCFIVPLTISLFVILGFRYRLILTFIGIMFVYLRKYELNSRYIFRSIVICVIAFYSFMFFSDNRLKLYSAQFSTLSYNPSDFDYNSIVLNLQGSVVDSALLKLIRENGAQHDYGETMFVYPLIMLLPSSFFNNNQKPYPAPQIADIDRSLKVPRSYGQACTFVGMAYYAYGIPGVIILSFLFGAIVSYLEFRSNGGSVLFLKISVLLASFQLYTRGYVGLFLIPLAFMVFSVLLVAKPIKWSKRHS